MSLKSFYLARCQSGDIQSDPRQLEAIACFQIVFDELTEMHCRNTFLLSRFRKRKLVQGLYLWGGVGIGKTFLMDCFYQNLPFPEKMRLHFHAFMQYIHHELKKYQGQQNPLDKIAKSLARQYRVICFDEFVVNDIVDAMLLRNLLEALFLHGVCFVATSNSAPDDLYKNGLQRTSFIPAIAILKKHANVVNLVSKQDYRLIQLKKSGVYFAPDNEHAHLHMEKIFSLLDGDDAVSVDPLIILERSITIIKRTVNIVWFDFHVICNIPRSQQDYLEIARQYKTILISHIPVFSPQAKNTVSLFIKLIDVLYDAGTPVIFSAAAPVEMLGQHLAHVPDYARIQSRLLEMQSEKYFSPHFFDVKTDGGG